jgi:iron complex transport system permease protein
MVRALRIWLLLATIAAAALVLSISTGSLHIPLQDVVRLLFSDTDTIGGEIIHRLRLPRTLVAFATGGLLGLAGALIQTLLRNPLADPYVLGVSGGSAVGALLAMLLGLGGVGVDIGAFAGALAAIALVFAFAQRDLAVLQSTGEADASPRFLLTGVILAAGWTAMVTLLLTLAPEAQLRGILFWLMGDLSGSERFAYPLVALAILLLLAYPSARALNVLLRGPMVAHALGVPIEALRWRIYFVASLATAVAVTAAGTVGFIGLIAPHAVRLAFGNDQRILLPGSVLAGGALLVVADTLGRQLLAPQQLPVGAVTAVIGVPTFMLLLFRSPRR